MKIFRLSIIFLLLSITLIKAEPYKPKPILFVHGIDGDSKAWGVKPMYKDTVANGKNYKITRDTINKDSIMPGDSMILPKCLEKLTPIVWAWYNWEGLPHSYTPTANPDSASTYLSYPNKSFLEIINFDDNCGSVNPKGSWPDRYSSPKYKGEGQELAARIRSVLGEYYGTGPSDTSRNASWVTDTSAKVILIAHSMGNTATHQAMIWDPMLVHHIYKHISVDGVNAGTWVATPGVGDMIYAYLMKHPLILLLFSEKNFSNIHNFGDYMQSLKNSISIKSIDGSVGIEVSLPFSPIWEIGSALYSAGVVLISPASVELVRQAGSIFQPAIRDLGKTSECIKENRAHSQAYIDGGAKFVSMIGDQFLGSHDRCFSIGGNIIKWNNVGAFVYGSGFSILAYFTATQQWIKLIEGSISMADWGWMDFCTDFWVDESGQNLNALNPNFNSRIIKTHNIQHSYSPYEADTIIKAIEDPPRVYIDSVAIKRDSMSDTIVALHQDRIDTLPGKPSKIYGRIYDYFLAQTENTFAFNEQSEYGGTINYGRDTITGNELGLNGNNFVIDSINSDWLFSGVNKIKVYSKNTVGEVTATTKKFYLNGDYLLDSLTPFEDYDFGLTKKYGNGNIWSDSLDGIIRLGFKLTSYSEVETLSISFDDENHVVKADIIHNDTDSIVTYYWCNLAWEPQEGEHSIRAKFKIKGNADTIKTGWNIYVDNTKPSVSIENPDSSKKYSQKADSIMYINLETSDDSMQQYFPKSDSIIIEIDSLCGNDTINVFRYKDTNPSNLYYGEWYVYKWDYRDNNGNIVPSGVYRLKIYVYDKAGNCGTDEKDFTVDNEPPKLVVIKKLSPNPFTSNYNEMTMEYKTNEHAEFSVTYTDTSDTLQKHYRTFIGDSTYDSTCNWDEYYYFEGENTQGSYLPDGIYNVTIKGKDDAGNDTIYNPSVFLEDSPYLRVDRTAPLVKHLNVMPYIIPKADTIAKINFILSEENDVAVNRGNVNIFVVVYKDSDTVFVKNDRIVPGIGDTLSYTMQMNRAEDSIGVYTVEAAATDQFGNGTRSKAVFVYGSFGAKITSPQQGDTVPSGFVTIKGYAGDPDMYNFNDFKCYKLGYLGYRKVGSVNWSHSNISVPEYRQGDSVYISKLPANDTTVLAYWKTEGLPSGRYVIDLKSLEEGGNSLEYKDTVYVNSGLSTTSPQLSEFELSKIAGNSGGTNHQSARDEEEYDPENGDKLAISYDIKNKISDVSMDISGVTGNVYHKTIHNVVPYKGKPTDSDETGYYIYSKNDTFYVKAYNNSGIIKQANLSILSAILSDTIRIYGKQYIGKTDTTDTINYLVAASIGGDMQIGGLIKDSSGIIVKFGSLYNRFKIKRGNGDSTTFYFGEDKVPFTGGEIDLNSRNKEVWDLKKFGGANVIGGNYTVKLTAIGGDGYGYDDTTGNINVKDNLKIEYAEITQNKLNPWAGIPAGLRFKLNEDGYVTVSVYKGESKVATILDSFGLAGNYEKNVSYYGNDSLERGDTLYFKITATNLGRTKTVERETGEIIVSNTPADSDANIYIPKNFFMGAVDGDSIFNGKGMYNFKAKYNALNYHPVLVRGNLNVSKLKDRYIKTNIEFYSQRDTIIKGINEIKNTGQPLITSYISSYDTTSLVQDSSGHKYDLLIKNLYYHSYLNDTTVDKSILVDSFYYDISNNFDVNKDTLIIKVYNVIERSSTVNDDFIRAIYFRIFKHENDSMNLPGTIVCSKPYGDAADIPSYEPKIDVYYNKRVPKDSLIYTVSLGEDTMNLNSGEIHHTIQKPYPSRIDIKIFSDGKGYTFANAKKDSVIKCNGFNIVPHSGSSNTKIVISPDTSKRNKWLDGNSYFIDTVIDGTDTINISKYMGSTNIDTVYFTPFGNDFNFSIDTSNTNIIFTKAISSPQFDCYLPDSTIKGKNIPYNRSGEFSKYGDKIYYKDYYNKSTERNLKLHLHFKMRKKTSDYLIHENEIWKSPKDTITNIMVRKFYNIPSIPISGILPNTDYKFIKIVRTHGNVHPNNTLGGNSNHNNILRGNGPYATYKLYLKSDSQSIYIGNENIDSIELYSDDDWNYSKDLYIDLKDTSNIYTLYSAIVPYGNIGDFDLSVTGEIMRDSSILSRDSCLVFGADSDTMIPLLGMNFIMKPSGNEINVKFHTNTAYFRTFFPSSASNRYIKFTKWSPEITYPNSKSDDDIFIDSIMTGDTLGDIHTDSIIGHGGYCYFRPEIYWTGKTPKDYVVLKTHTPISTNYRLFYIQDSVIKPVDSIMHNPMNVNDSILGYWNTANVFGKVRLLVFQYNRMSGIRHEMIDAPDNGNDSNPDSIKYRDFYIGSVVRGATGGNDSISIVSSPYGRAVLYFPDSSFQEDTLAKVTPVGFDEDNIGESSPYIGGNIGPVVKMYPMGKQFDTSDCPRLEYKFTNREKRNYNIETNDISLFSIGDDGLIRRINASYMIPNDSNGDTIWTLTARPEEFPRDGQHRYFTALKDSETAELGIVLKKTKIFPDGRVVLMFGRIPTDNGVICPNKLILIDVRMDSIRQDSLEKLRAINIYDVEKETPKLTGFTRSEKKLNIDKNRGKDSTLTISVTPGIHKLFLIANSLIADSISNRGNKIKNGGSEIKNSEVIVFYIDNSKSVITEKDTLVVRRDKPDTLIVSNAENYYVDYTLFNENNTMLMSGRYSPDANGVCRIIWDGYIDGIPVNSGNYYGRIIVSDSTGNIVFNKTVVWNVNLDYNLSILSPSNDENLRGDVPLYTNISGENIKWYIKSESPWILIGEDAGDGFTLQTALYGDMKNVWMKAVIEDAFGNTGEDSVTVSIDNTPPEIDVIKSGTGSNDRYSKLHISVDVSDSVSDLAFVHAVLRRGEGYTYNRTINPNSGTSFSIDADTLNEGDYELNVNAKDNAGNVNNYSYDFTIDRTAPVLSLRGEPVYFEKNNFLCLTDSGRIEIDAADEGSSNIEYALNNFGPHSPGNERWSVYNGPIECSAIMDSATIHYRATDDAGNESQEKSAEIFVNRNLPTTIFSYSLLYVSGDTQFISPDASVSITADSTFVGIKSIFYKISDIKDDFEKYTQPINIREPGMHEISAYALNNLDQSGDINSDDVYVDATPPSVSIQVEGKAFKNRDEITIDTASVIRVVSLDGESGIKHVGYELNGIMHEYTAPFNISVEGHHDLTVIAGDNVGNETQKSFDINVVDDKLNAKFCTIGPEYNGYISDSTLLEITIIDSAAGIDSMMYKIDGGNYMDYTEPFSIGDYAEGAHKIDMKITDLMGNVFEDSANYILDETSPVINSEIVGNHFDTDSIHFLQNSSFLVSLFSDSLSGVLSSGFKINDLGWSDIPDSFDINLSSFSDGYYRIELRSKDRVENISYDTIYLCLDDSAPDDSLIPVGRYIVKGDTLYLSGEDEIGISCRDDYSGTDSVMWAINNGIFSPYTGNISMSGITEGVNNFIVKTSDLLGNQRTDTSILNIDNVPPVISDTLTGKQIQIDSTIFVKDSTRLRLIFKDTSSGIYENSCKINNFYTIYLPDTFEMDFSAFADGFLNLLISSEDNVGNNDTMNLNYCVDNTPPDIDISYVRAALFDSVFTSPHSAIFINSADGYSGIDSIIYKINNGNYYPYHDSIICGGFTEGKHYISVIANDRMGNGSTLIDSFYQDNSAPEVTFAVSGPHFMSNDTVFVSSESKISFEETDSLSGADSVFYSFDGVYLPYTGDSISLTGEDSVYTLYYFGKDRVGNVSDTSKVFFSLDNTPPSVNIYFPFNKIVLNTNRYSDEATGEETDSFYFRYRVSDKDSIKSVIYFHRTPYDSVVVNTFALSSEDSVKYDYVYVSADPPVKYREADTLVGVYGPYMFTIKTEDMLGNSRLDTLYGFEGGDWYDMINGQYNFRADFTVKNDFIYVANPISAKNNKNRYDILTAGIYKYDLEGKLIDSLPENNFLGGIKVDNDENIYSLYLNDSYKGKGNDTVALKINFETGNTEAIMDSVGSNQLCGIDIDSFGNVYIGMQGESDTLRIDVFDEYLNLTSINRFSDAKRCFTVDDSQNIYIVFMDSISQSPIIKKYNKSVNGYAEDESFNLTLPYGVDQVWAINRDTAGIFYISSGNSQSESDLLYIVYPMYNFNGKWKNYTGYRYVAQTPNNFMRYGDYLYYINNNLYSCDISLPLMNKKAKKFSGEGTNKNLEISEFVPYPSPFDPLKESARIRVDINRDAIADLYILDLAGIPIKTIKDINLTSGLNEVEWDGKNEAGRICNNGVYSVVIKAKSGKESAERYTKIMLIKKGE